MVWACMVAASLDSRPETVPAGSQVGPERGIRHKRDEEWRVMEMQGIESGVRQKSFSELTLFQIEPTGRVLRTVALGFGGA